jgi:predicted transcriptional regulator
MSMRLPDDLALQLGKLAKATGRTKSFLVLRALRDFVEREAWQVAEIQQGIDEADQGLFASEEEVQALFHRSRKPPRQSGSSKPGIQK